MPSKKKHIHFIGIAGSIIAPLAVAMKKQGWRVTGSDVAFYPPASTFLVKNKIEIIPGHNPDKFKKIGKPDIAMVMSFLTPNNPEVKYLKKQKVELIGLGQLLERFFITKNSIVITGNYGKTTIASLLGWVLEVAGKDPSVLVGGYMHNFKTGVKIGRSDWSVSEGDEFQPWFITRKYKFIRKPRLLLQKPKYVVFTDSTWDHYDLYPTKESYLNTFIKFMKLIPKTGFVLGNAQGKNVKQVLDYTKSDKFLLKASDIANIKFTVKGSEFDLLGDRFKTSLLGDIGVLNSSLAISMALQLSIKVTFIKKALRSYKGVKRRQEVRLKKKNLIIMDDFAHSPVKLHGVISSLRQHYKKEKIILVYQPGSKDTKAFQEYKAKTFVGIDYIALPRISTLTHEAKYFNALLANKLKRYKGYKSKVRYIDDDNKMILHLNKKIKQYKKNHSVLVLFAGQKGFRGMIEQLVKSNR